MPIDDVIEIDLPELVKKYAVLLILSTVLCGVAAFGTSYLMPNETNSRVRDGEVASRLVGVPVVGHFQTAGIL